MITPTYMVLRTDACDLQSRFHPDHWADLQKSGLNAETILAAGVCSVPPDLISREIGFDMPTLRSALCFPYKETEGFARYKIFPALVDKAGHKVRYLQRKNSGVHLYFTPHFRARLAHAEKIYIAEGEKKTLRADQEGLCVFGLGGIFAWKDKSTGGLIRAFDSIAVAERQVRLIPDGDFRTNPMVWRGVEALCLELRKRGAHVKLVDLTIPVGPV